jgi:uncharacterized protein (DUF1800 family)
MQITVPSSAMQVSANQTLTAKRIFKHAPGKTSTVPVKWYSSNVAAASVDNAGKVTATASTGTTLITAVSGPFSATVPVVVVPSGTFTALSISAPNPSIAKGLTQQYAATATIGGATVDVTPIATWNSTAAAVAPIDSAGSALGLTVGTTNITATLTIGGTPQTSNSLPLTVGAAQLLTLAVKPSTVFIAAAVLLPPQTSTFQLSATGVWTDGIRDNTNDVTWSTSSSAAATVSGSGLVTAADTDPANRNDLATITASLSDGTNPTLTANAQVNVMTYNEAGRFLEQATFGPTPADVAHLQSIGFDAWFNEQFGMPQAFSNYPAAPDIPTVQNRFYFNALTGQDQLRMRLAFALEQIWVISSNKVTDPNGFVPWQNMMERDAFGNYRDLMGDVTLNPAMGVYLDMVNNDKPQTGQNPNENYAREVLQLFTIGLFKLNDNGSQFIDPVTHNPVPTYDEPTVQGFAHVFTGWTFPTMPGHTQQSHNPSYYGVAPYGSPMENVAGNHDISVQTLLNGATVSGTAGPELNAALDNIFNYSSLPPFICPQLIEHLVKSNPSPTYITNVVNVFKNNGSGVRGDMQAVVKAILMDPEARAGDFPSGVVPNTDGHLREPSLFMVGALRALNSTDTGSSLASRDDAMGENILDSPTVFNFFSPYFVIPQNYFNPVQVGVVGPEFGIHTPQTAVSRANYVSTVVYGSLEASVLTTLNSYNTLAASSPAGLVDALNLRLMHGKMSSAMKTQVVNAVSAYPASPALTRVQAAVYLILSSSQYQVIY